MPKRLLLTTLFLAVIFGTVPSVASAADCWKELVNDYWADNRVDRTYPISCYREAMEKLPRDVQEYSDAQDDLRRALLLAIQDQRDSGGGYTGGTGTTEPPPPADDNALNAVTVHQTRHFDAAAIGQVGNQPGIRDVAIDARGLLRKNHRSRQQKPNAERYPKHSIH